MYKRQASQCFVSPPTPPTSAQSSAVESVPSACDAATCTSDCSPPPCESPRPLCPRFVAASSSASAQRGDSARALANSTPTAHCNDACTPRSSLVQPFSLQCEAVPLKDISTSTVAEALLNMFSRVGLPHRIHSDRGSQFTSEMMRKCTGCWTLDSPPQLRIMQWGMELLRI